MNTKLKTFALLMCFAAGGMLVSCTKEEGYKDLLVGKWQQIEAMNTSTGQTFDIPQDGPLKCIVEFKRDNTFTLTNEIYFYPNTFVGTGTYRIKDDILELTESFSGKKDEVPASTSQYKIIEINAGFLSLKPLTLIEYSYPEVGYYYSNYPNVISATLEGSSKYKRLTWE
jgi:hypothetical protein